MGRRALPQRFMITGGDERLWSPPQVRFFLFGTDAFFDRLIRLLGHFILLTEMPLREGPPGLLGFSVLSQKYFAR